MKTDNEIIAKFMGLMVFQTYEEMQKVPIEKLTEWVTIDQIKYNTSWDWLMPVVERISEPVVSGDQLIRSAANVDILYKACKITFEPDEDFEDYGGCFIQSPGETKIEAVYNAVVEFIKWYNSVTKQVLQKP